MVGGGKSCIYVEYDGCPTEIKRLRKVLVRSSYPQICLSVAAESPSGDTSASHILPTEQDSYFAWCVSRKRPRSRALLAFCARLPLT